LISRQQQIQNLRKYIAEEIESVGLKVTFINALKSNNQNVTNTLVNSILQANYRTSGKYLKISSGWNAEAKVLTNINIDIKLPWGLYGAKLDIVEGRRENAESPMRVSINSIYDWMNRKGIFKTGFYRMTNRGRSYNFPLKRESYRKAIAYRIARKINREQQFKTRNPYSAELSIKLEFAVFKAFERFRDEYLLDFMDDFALTFTKGE
jgi:hypothetical protein